MKKKDYDKFLEKFLKEHAEELCERVDAEFENQKEEIKASVLDEIKSYLSPVPTHFVWKDDGCPYDHSGIIVENGVVDLDQTVDDFLMFEYTGTKMPSFESGRGWNYETYDDFLSQYTFEIGSDIMVEEIQKFIEEQFKAELPENLFEFYDYDTAFDHIYNDIYDNCIAWKFFYYEGVFEFLGTGIGDMLLSDLVG